MADTLSPYGWWLLECGHYGHEADEKETGPTLRCRVCPDVAKFSGHAYSDRPDRRKVTPVVTP
jgi:hypothetical protein